MINAGASTIVAQLALSIARDTSSVVLSMQLPIYDDHDLSDLIY
jgi:hypothetical protein